MKRAVAFVLLAASGLAAQEAKPTYEGSPSEAIKFERKKEAAAQAQAKKEAQKQVQASRKEREPQRRTSARNRPTNNR